MTVWKMVWADLMLVVLGKCSSYRGGSSSRFNSKWMDAQMDEQTGLNS